MKTPETPLTPTSSGWYAAPGASDPLGKYVRFETTAGTAILPPGGGWVTAPNYYPPAGYPLPVTTAPYPGTFGSFCQRCGAILSAGLYVAVTAGGATHFFCGTSCAAVFFPSVTGPVETPKPALKNLRKLLYPDEEEAA